MNILITSCGRRSELIKYFVNEFNGKGSVIVTDCDKLAPALYFADKYYITPKISSDDYMSIIYDICKKENIKGILSLIDPELSLLSKNKKILNSMGVKLIGCDYKETELCFDKYEFFKKLDKNKFNVAKTYIDINKFKIDYKSNKIEFPVFLKPRNGSASIGINKITNMNHLEILFDLFPNMIIQEFIDGEEYGVDAYIDLISNEVISIFAKKKIRMRSGETDKALSIKDESLFNEIERLVNILNLKGTIDIDVFKKDNKWIISEINPRFGGGHPLAYKCGQNYPKYILNNLMNNINKKEVGKYCEGKYMIKHDTLMVI